MIHHQLTNRQLKAVEKYFRVFCENHRDRIVTGEENGIIRVFLHDRFNASINVKNIIGIPMILTFITEYDYNRFIRKVGKR